MTAIDWRSRHCADLAIAAVAEARGSTTEAVWAELGGRPGSWKEAASLYRRLGVRTLYEAVCRVLGPPLRSPRLAHRGDVVMIDGSLGVSRGEKAVCLGEAGEIAVPMRRASRAWRACGMTAPACRPAG